MLRDSMVFYRSCKEAISCFDTETKLACYECITDYGLNGIEPEGLNAIEKAVFLLVKPQIDANNERYKNGLKGGSYGKKGGRPRKNPTGVINENPIGVTGKTPNENVTGNENENENVTLSPSEMGESESKDYKNPTLNQVREYFSENHYTNADPDEFYNHYAANGWKMGRNPVVDWKAAAKAWDNRKGKEVKEQQTKNIAFNPTAYLLDMITD